jgi:hypothetical protein
MRKKMQSVRKEPKPREIESPKARDNWDKAAIIGQLISGVALSAFGIVATFITSRGRADFRGWQKANDPEDRQYLMQPV